MNKENRNSDNSIVLLHGYGETSEIWNRLLPCGCGIKKINLAQTFDTPHSITLKDIASTIAGELDGTQITLIAKSMGGYIALEMMSLAPDRIKEAIIISSHPLADSATKRKARDREMALINSGRAHLLGHTFTSGDEPAVRNLKLKMWNNWSSRALVNATSAMAQRRDTTEILISTKIKTTFILGEDDSSIDKAPILELAATNPCISVVIVDGAGHWLLHEKPEFISTIINRCL